MATRTASSKSKAKSEQEALLEEADSGANNFIDLSGVKAERFGGSVPKGRYLTELESIKRGETGSNSKNPGASKLTLTFKILEDDDGEPFSGKVFLHPVLTGEQAGRARGYLEDLGADLDQPFDPDSLIGVLSYLTVSVQKDNPSFNNVDKIELLEDDAAEDEALN